MTEGNIHAQSVCELLGMIRARHPDIAITLVMDNARYQRCAAVSARAVQLGIERLWKLVKKRCLTNRHYQNFADFRHAIDNCLHELTTTANAELHSLLTLNFQLFSK